MRLSLAAGVVAGIAALASGAGAQQKSEDEMFKLMKSERIGALRLDMTEAQVKQILTARPVISREQLWGADGQYHLKWTYGAQGVRLGLVSEKKGGPKIVESIDCTARCTLTSARGIGIGSTLADVQKAYAAEFNKDESKLPQLFVAGTIYGGLLLKFKAGKVSSMFLGAAAE
ncbi:MAG TPA: hypothetical protein VIF14_06670 [Alphaproteobacteria bacterium]|jgi:hypothetical protein